MAIGLQLRAGSSGVLGRHQLGQQCRPKPVYQAPHLPFPLRTGLHRSSSKHPTAASYGRWLGPNSDVQRVEECQSIGSASESSSSRRKAPGFSKSIHRRGQAFRAASEGTFGDQHPSERQRDAASGGPLAGVLSAGERVVRFLVVKIVFVIHRLVLVVTSVALAVVRFRPVRALTNATVAPIDYSRGEPTFRTPPVLKPLEWLLRLVLFFVPPFIKRRVGPVIHGVAGRLADRSLALIRKCSQQGLSGAGEWGRETVQIAREDAPVVVDFVVRFAYRGLQLGALIMLASLLRRAYYLTPDQYEWIPKSAGKVYHTLWAVIDYLFLDMDWVQPLQRFIAEVVWPFWRDYWILSAVCVYLWQRLYPGVVTFVDIYGDEAED